MKLLEDISIWIAAAALTATGIVLSIFLWGQAHDPYGMVRWCVRMMVVTPIIFGFGIAGIRLLDRYTPGTFMQETWDNEIARAIIVAVLFACVVWVGVQG